MPAAQCLCNARVTFRKVIEFVRISLGISIAALYALLGAGGLTLAIPPGYASPIFPAAGLALAVVLFYGRIALPWVWLGSFVLNVGHALWFGHLSGATWLAAACIAVGSSLQAWIGQWLISQNQGETWRHLESESQIVAFLFRGGVLACLVSASVAVVVLWGLGVISRESMLFSWWTWYTGDLLGVAIFAPLALLFLAPKTELSLERRRRIVVPICIALGLSMVLYAGATFMERRQVHTRVEHEGATLGKLIQDRLITHQAVLSSLAHFVEASPDFSHRQFELFTQAALAENHDIFALSFNDAVTRAQLRAYEASVSRSSPLGAFHATERDAQRRLVPVGDREGYVIVRHIVPIRGNAPAVGFDIQSEPMRRDAVARSRASGKPAATGPIRLVQEDAVRMGVLVLDPVNTPHPASSEARGELTGFAVAVLKVDELIGIATRGLIPVGLNFRVHDRQESDPSLNFYASGAPSEVADYRRWSTALSIADRQWALDLWADDAFVNQGHHWMSWAVGVVALLFTGLLQIYLHGMTGRTLAIRRQNAQLLEKQAELQLAETVFDNTSEAIVVTDASGLIISVNPTFSRITGYSLSEVRGRTMNVLKSGEHSLDFYRELWSQLLAQRRWQGEMVNRRKNGELFTELLTITAVSDSQGRVVQYVGTFSDITEKIAARQRIEFMAYHDALTELPNRVLGKQRAQEAMVRAHRYGFQVGIVFMDLDHFKLVNDTYGHSVGDKLLQAVTHRLRAHLRSEDTLCRLSGDEFMLILEHIRDVKDIASTCAHVLQELARPYEIDGRLIQTSLSVGISVYPGDGDSEEDLLRKADTAMFEAKQGGRNTYRFFDPGMNRSVVEFVETRDALALAIQRGEFELYYQPQIDLRDQSVAGVEALIRWNHPVKGLIGPAHIISVAEQSGLIVPIGAWVLQQACRQMKAWLDQGWPIQTMAVNLSGVQFMTGDIEQTVLEALEGAGLAPGCLELELTESILISDKDRALSLVHQLKEIGVRLSIDDFGTGYSSMSYLKRFHVDKIKIDASFASGVGRDAEDTAIVRSIIQMAQALGLETTAEGIDRPEVVPLLQDLGCTQIQGYVYARPMPAAGFADWLRGYLPRKD
mgnify:CR=1 FL=1